MNGLKFLKIGMYAGATMAIPKKESIFIQALYFGWKSFLYFSLISTIIQTSIDACFKENATVLNLSSNVMTVAIYLAGFARIFQFTVNSGHVQEILGFVEFTFKKVSNTLSKKVTNESYTRKARIFPCIWIVYIFYNVFIIALIPLFDNTGEIDLPTPLWFPYNVTKDSQTHILTMSWITITQIVMGFTFTSHDTFLIVISILLRGQFYILGYEIRKIFHTALELHGVPEADIKIYFENKCMSEMVNGTPVIYKKEIQITAAIDKLLESDSCQSTLNRLLCEVIVYHQKMIKCAHTLQTFESPVLLMILGLGMIYLTFTEFNLLIVKNNLMMQAVLLNYTVCCYVEFFVLTYNVHMLIQDSMTLRENLLHIYWFCGNKKFKSNVLFMLKRMEVAVDVKAGNHFSFGIPLYINLCKTCFSYITMLRNFQQTSD